MDPFIKNKWVEALRSGEYKQGRTQLRNENNEFCCLGVLCNLHAQEFPELAAKQEDAEAYYGSTGGLHEVVRHWAKLDTNFGVLGRIEAPYYIRASAALYGTVRSTWKKGDTVELATLNDDGCNFRQIADIIEQAL